MSGRLKQVFLVVPLRRELSMVLVLLLVVGASVLVAAARPVHPHTLNGPGRSHTAAVPQGSVSSSWYFAQGYTGTGFTEYLNYPSATFAFRPRWGDYGNAILAGGKAYFASEFIQSPNCAPPAFQPNTIGTCGGTRDGLANWGTSVNFVTP